MTNQTHAHGIPIYTSKGDAAAFLVYPYLFNPQGDWIGWVAPDRQIYSVHGHYVGWLSNDPRILRREAAAYDMPPRKSPPPPAVIFRAPATVPLAPLMPDLASSVCDVLLEAPDLLPSVDAGELRQDLD